MFFKKVMDILVLDLQSVHYEKRELILDAINQVSKINTCVQYTSLIKELLISATPQV